MTFIASIVVIPVLVARIPADYFAGDQRNPPAWTDRHRVLRAILLVAKNLLGIVFVLAGIAMLVLPGQGILTILIGAMMLDVPGKYHFERWLIQKPAIWRAVSWLRKKAGKAPLRL